MRYSVGKILGYAFGIMGWFTTFQPLAAQTPNEKIALRFDSTPVGAVVRLVGNHTIIGKTPFQINYTLNGLYEVSVVRTGFNAWNGRILFDGNEKKAFSIALTPKTRLNAVWRSMLLPGWGHLYSERKISGFVNGGVVCVAMAATALSAINYHQKVNRYETACQKLKEPVVENVQYQQLWRDVLKKNEAADQALKYQQKIAWITASLWILNVVDAYWQFPKIWENQIDRNGFLISFTPDRALRQVSLEMHF